MKKRGEKNKCIERTAANDVQRDDDTGYVQFCKDISKLIKRWGDRETFCMATPILSPSLIQPIRSLLEMPTWFFCLSGQLLGFSSGGAKLKHRS